MKLHSGIVGELRVVGMVWERELIRYVRTRTRILSGLIQPVLFLFVLGYGMSGLVGTVGGFNFHQFVYPGVVAMSVVMTAMFSALSIVWDREFGFLREMLIAPVSRSTLVLGKTVGGATVAAVQGTIMLVLAPLVGIHLTPLLVVADDRPRAAHGRRHDHLRRLRGQPDLEDGVVPSRHADAADAHAVPLRRALPPQRTAHVAGLHHPPQPAHLCHRPVPSGHFRRPEHVGPRRARTSRPVSPGSAGPAHWLELSIVVVFAVVFFVLAFRGLSRTE